MSYASRIQRGLLPRPERLAAGLLATDGVIDQPGGSRQIAFGDERLRRSFARRRADRLAGAIEGMKAEFDAYAQGETRRDDVTIVAIAPRLA